ncbi:cytochrome c oxidase subunit 3 [Catalinimonas niigatensis]|uniref:cytochrome c oxidase subunit 3 n=1 Tax=Catalinimonas niigatensis TaxID=1397264 RepID=UPI0026661FA8|nr:cytochrome c oxidase subunit 3 [Catalinimonas niigatensis]WPP48116.1 cytochrome c oxidase subunit 3 [Catalinimonas niigatensis]
MHQQNKNNTEEKRRETAMARLEKIHPHKMLLYLAIFGSSLVFLFMITAYTFSRPEEDFSSFAMPKSFVVSLVILLLSSFAISKALPAFKKDNIKEVRRAVEIALLLGLGFTISQYIGWYELNSSGIHLTGKDSGAYLYIISGLHILHLAGGLVFLTLAYTNINTVSRDPVKTLIVLTNPYERIRLEMLVAYWHFVDILWIVLFFYFLFSF